MFLPPPPPPVRSHARRFSSLLTLLTLLLTLLPAARPAQAAGTVVVKPSSLAGWALGNESPPQPTGSGSFVSGPDTAPAGSGSVQFTVDGTGSYLLGTALYNGTRFDQLTALSYSTYRVTGSAALAPALQLNVDYNLDDANTAWQGRLIFEPYLAGTVSTGAWQTWNPLAGPASGSWWSSGAPGNGVCPQGNPCTAAEVLAAFPNAGIHATLGALLFKAGSSWTGGFTGNVDLLTVGVDGDDTSYNFEPETACTTTCYVDAATGNDSFGGDTPSSAKKTIAAAMAQVSTDGTVVVAAGTYAESVTIANDGVTLRGAGSGADPATNTVLQGPVGTSPGVRLPNSGTTGVTISDLRVQQFSNGGICSSGTNNNDLTISSVAVISNTTGAGCQGGIYANGPVSNVTITDSLAQGNTTRGIVIWNGFKQNITITNNTVTNNNCCGIELQDGTASGVTITGNTITNNADNGIGVNGLTTGAGPNLIANNVLTDNGRFGIEIKLPNGSGLETGDGSIVVRNNTVRRLTPIEIQRPSEERDLGGIVVIRRAYLVGTGYADVPRGVVVRDNTVSGYRQTNANSLSEGFGIVVEGYASRVYGNTVSDNDVGIQRQSGHLPYTPNASGDGDQSDLADEFFGRGNSPYSCAVLGSNTLSGNAVSTRALNAGVPTVFSVDTGIGFCSIQQAIDDWTTQTGHMISVPAGSYAENVVVSKSVTLQGANDGVNPNDEARSSESRISPAAGSGIVIAAHDVTVDGFTIAGDPAIAGGAGYEADTSGITLTNNIVESDDGAVGIELSTPNADANERWTIADSRFDILGADVTAISLQRAGALITGVEIDGAEHGIVLDTGVDAELHSSMLTNVMTGVLLLSGSEATLSDVQLSNAGALADEGTGVVVESGASATLDGSVGVNRVEEFGVGVRVAGTLSLSDTNVVSGTHGLVAVGSDGAVTLGNSRFAGQSDTYITLSNYPDDINARQAFFAGTRGDALSIAQYLAVQDKIVDVHDLPGLGEVLLSAIPGAPVISSPEDGAYVSTSQPTISGTADAGTTVTVVIDGSVAGTATVSGAGAWSFTPAALTLGEHSVLAYATSSTGHDGPDSDTITFTYATDSVAPDTAISDSPASITNASSATFVFTGTDDTSGAPLIFRCSLDGGAFAPCTSPASYSGLAAGSHTFRVYATDFAGNADDSPASVTWIVDQTAPVATLQTPAAATLGAPSLSFTVVYSDAVAMSSASLGTGDILVSGPNSFSQQATLVSLSASGDGTVISATYRLDAPGGSWNPADNGTYTISVVAGQALDEAGNAVAAGPLGTTVVNVWYRQYLPMVRLNRR